VDPRSISLLRRSVRCIQTNTRKPLLRLSLVHLERHRVHRRKPTFTRGVRVGAGSNPATPTNDKSFLLEGLASRGEMLPVVRPMIGPISGPLFVVQGCTPERNCF
jgi:hypothetical protein